MTERVQFVVLGLPQTQGSKTAFVPKGQTKPVLVEGKTKKARSNFDAWRQAVATEARVAMAERPMLDGPLVVRAFFGLVRPASAPKRTRTWPIAARSGDVDKLLRAVLDAMTGVVFADDAQVVAGWATKDYAPKPGVVVEVEDASGWVAGLSGASPAEWAALYAPHPDARPERLGSVG